mgnify:CR=1 FL=1|jgi:hypothetical protein
MRRAAADGLKLNTGLYIIRLGSGEASAATRGNELEVNA